MSSSSASTWRPTRTTATSRSSAWSASRPRPSARGARADDETCAARAAVAGGGFVHLAAHGDDDEGDCSTGGTGTLPGTAPSGTVPVTGGNPTGEDHGTCVSAVAESGSGSDQGAAV